MGTIVVGAVTAAVVIAVIVTMIKNKKKGKTSCGCGCTSCPMQGSCHPASKVEFCHNNSVIEK